MKTMKFNWKNYGDMIMSNRLRKIGFTQLELVSILNKVSPVFPGKHTLSRIEKGQRPTVEQFIIMNLVLFGKVFPRKHLMFFEAIELVEDEEDNEDDIG